jgi:RNA polymerase sigma factor (TIGR02999 family)
LDDTAGDVTDLLRAWNRGEDGAEPALLSLVYAELRALAIGHLKTERSDHTLEPAALIHEAYLRLVDQNRTEWRDRHHFFGIASRMMRRVLTDYARRRSRAKRGGNWVRVTMDAAVTGAEPLSFAVGALDDALKELSALDDRKSRIVELRFFGGLTIDETAVFLSCSPATVRRDWTVTKAWLIERLG